MNKQGFTIMETVLSLLVISLLVFTVLVIQNNNRSAILKTEAKMTAENIIIYSLDYLTSTTDYPELETWYEGLADPNLEVTSLNCVSSGIPILCDVFEVNLNSTTLSEVNRVSLDDMAITFSGVHNDNGFTYIEVTITIEYVPDRFIDVVGDIHE